jgi:metallo-beta-lactamase family protein
VRVELGGERYDIRAGIHRLDGYSAHADEGLVNFIRRMRHPPRQVRLVQAKRALKAKLEELGLGIEVVLP